MKTYTEKELRQLYEEWRADNWQGSFIDFIKARGRGEGKFETKVIAEMDRTLLCPTGDIVARLLTAVRYKHRDDIKGECCVSCEVAHFQAHVLAARADFFEKKMVEFQELLHRRYYISKRKPCSIYNL